MFETSSGAVLGSGCVDRKETWVVQPCRSISPVGKCHDFAELIRARSRAKRNSYFRRVAAAWHDEKNKADVLYVALEPWARSLKILLQMGIGTVAMYLIILNAWAARHDDKPNNLPDAGETLKIIAGGLAIAAAAELAYTLFTKGPDEAVDPLMLGLASALLYQLASLKDLTSGGGMGTLLLVFSLGTLFIIRQVFVTNSGLPCLLRGRRNANREASEPGETESIPG